MAKKDLILVGGGGHCKAVIDVAESAGYNILGVLDKPEEVGNDVLAYKVIGTDDDIPKYVNDAEFIITVGQINNCNIRKKIDQLIKNAGGRLATIIANDAYVSKYSSVGSGSVIMHKAFVNADAHIGENVILNTMANVGHDVRIGDFCHISTGVMICGNATIGNEVFIGSQSVVNQGVDICNNVVLSSMSVSNKNIVEPGVYVGAPAKHLKK